MLHFSFMLQVGSSPNQGVGEANGVPLIRNDDFPLLSVSHVAV
jgi:hypothetical protein